MSTPAYDIYFGDKASLQGYRCKSLIRDSAPLVAPRFSSGVQGETDLDLLKSQSIDNLSGGMFQRTHLDPTKVARGVGYYNSFDENFYPTLPTSTPSGTSYYGNVYAKAESESYSFVNFYQRSGGASYNGISKIIGNVVSSLTMPAAIYGAASVTEGKGLCLHKGYLFIAITNGSTNHRYDIAGNSFTNIGGNAEKFFTLRGNLYSITSAGVLNSVTNETTATATYTQIAQVGGTDTPPLDAVEFNGAAWIVKADGIYRFDGVNCIKILSLKATFMTVWNGALWFMVNNWLYRFDGNIVQKIQYFTETVWQISSTNNYLFVQQFIVTGTADTGKVPSLTGYVRLYAYDGQAFSIILEKDITTEASYQHALVYTSNYLTYMLPQANVSWDLITMYSTNISNIFSSSAITSASALDITSSEDDNGFPNIYKSLETIEINYSGLINGDVITVKYQLYDGINWGSWQTLGTINYASTSNRLDITDFSNKLYKRVKINVYVSTMTAGSTITIKGFSWRYTLQPRARWRWQLDVYVSGNNVMLDRNNSPISTDSNALTISTIKSIKQKTPLFLLTPDYGLIKTQINSAATSFIVPGQFPVYTDPYTEYQLIAVQNNNSVWEIMQILSVSYNSGTDETTINVVARGYLGITAAQINANAEVRLCYKVYITRLIRDAPMLDSNTYNEQTTGESQLQREFLLEATEV